MHLVHSELTEDEQKRLTRIRCDVRVLVLLSPAKIRTVYDQLEIVRDLISTVLDKADEK